MDYKQVAVYKEQRLLEKVDRLNALLYKCIVAFEEEQTFDTKDTMLRYLGMSKKNIKKSWENNMNKVNLKCGGFMYIEPFDDHEEEDRCKLYDEHMNYWDYVDVGGDEILAHARYDEYVKYFEELEDIHNYLGAVLYSYTCGNTIEDLIDNMCDDMAVYYTDDELEDERRQMLTYLEKCGEEPFCREYCVAKIANLYVYSEG